MKILNQRCSQCKKVKKIKDFCRSSNRSHGYSYVCKKCSSKNTATWQQKNKDKVALKHRKHHLKKTYNIVEEDYNQMILSQNGVCKICNKKNSNGKRLAIDHDHKTGQIRGLLCIRCNYSLGHFEDSID